MGLIRKGKYWWLDCRIRGRRYRRSLYTTKKNIALARYGEKLEELQAEFGIGKIRFSDFSKKYMEWAWSTKPKSAIHEELRLQKIEAFFNELKIVFLDDITPYHIEQLKAKLNNDELSKTTINLYLQILRCMFYRAIDWEIYNKSNPLKKIKFYKRERPVRGLSKEELIKVLNEAKRISENPRSKLQTLFYDLCVFGLNTGMKRSEVLNLTWRSIKDDMAEITGKGEKRRTVPLNKKAIEVIQKQPKKSAYVFDIENRNSATLFVKSTDRIKRETGVDFHYHLLRHSYSSMLMEKGVDIVTIGSLLGHSKTSISLIYTHTSEERKKKAAEILEKEWVH